MDKLNKFVLFNLVNGIVNRSDISKNYSIDIVLKFL